MLCVVLGLEFPSFVCCKSDQGLTWTTSLASGKLNFSQIFLGLNRDLDIVHYGKYKRAVVNVNAFYSCPWQYTD